MANSKTNPDLGKVLTATPTSAAPTGLALTRDANNKFTLTWKKGPTYQNRNYIDQGVRYRRKTRTSKDAEKKWLNWSTVTVSATATTTNKTYALSDYYPTTERRLDAIQVEVRGLENAYETKSAAYLQGDTWYYDLTNNTPKWSDYVKAIVDLKVPSNVNYGTVTPGSTNTVFAYSITNDAVIQPFADVEWQSRLVQNWGTKDPTSGIAWSSGNTGWKTGTSANASESITVAEDTGLIGSTKSYTRIIRMRGRGAAGAGNWTYKSYIYAWPLELPASSVTASQTAISGGYRVTVSFTPNKDDTHPAETYRVEYLIGTPLNGSMTAPSGSWQTGAAAFAVTGSTGAATFNINSTLTTDQALWVRVVQLHGSNETPGQAKFVLFGGVTKVGPTALAVTTYNSSTKSLTLTCSNPSSIATSMIRIWAYYKSNGKWNSYTYLEIAHGQTSVTATVNLNDYAEWAFDTYVGIGNGYWSEAVRTTYSPRTEATNPAAYYPTIGSVVAGSSAGSIVVNWANVMGGVTGAEITVATAANEWTKATPTWVADVTVSGTDVKTATITGLSLDTAYYVKVKTTNTNGSSDWSANTGTITLKSTDLPTPVLTAEETTEHYIKVSWNWATLSQATAINISWSDQPDFGKTDYKLNEVTISKKGNTGTDSYTITDVERGKTWYIQAEFIVDAAVTRPGSTYCNLPINPVAPTSITAVREAQTTDEATKTSVRVTWVNGWADADSTEISWSDNPNAWNATSGLNTYSLTGTDGRRETVLIPGLQMGKTWYFKVKLMFGTFETSYSSVSPVALDLRTAPVTPIVTVGSGTVSENSHTDISWSYSCEDGAEQSAVAVSILNSSNTEVASFGIGGDEKSFALYPATYGLTGNNTYYIKVQTVSANGKASEWSAAVPFEVWHKPIVSISSTSLILTSGVYYLKSLPLTVTTSSVTGTVTVYIERAQTFFEDTPDEDQRGGYEGELMALATKEGGGAVNIDLDTLRGILNDGATFRIVVIASDDLGKSDPVTLDFVVDWTHQATIPDATREVDVINNVVEIRVTAPGTAVSGDVIDIYRLSADKPELIVENGEFGETYVDPYPAFGEYGGHRIVYKTLNGDITTANGELAWVDLDGSCDASDVSATTDARLDCPYTVINFSGYEIRLPYNLTLSNNWTKDFKETKYLGGAVRGDWNPAVSRTLSVDSVSIVLRDVDTIKTMRRLCLYDGICHVRTPDGSSFAADIQVSESRTFEEAGKIANFSMSITRVDPEQLDGLTIDEWDSGESGESA